MNHTPALLVIDMQNDFVRPDGNLPVVGAESIIGKVRDVMEWFRSHHLPVIHVLRVHRADGSDVEWFRRDLFATRPFGVEGTWGAAVIDELTPKPGEMVLRKTRMSAFTGTELDLVLRALSTTALVVTGIQTPNCVRTTVFDAMALGYHVTVVADATAAKANDVHEANLADMAAIGVQLVNTGDIGEVLEK